MGGESYDWRYGCLRFSFFEMMGVSAFFFSRNSPAWRPPTMASHIAVRPERPSGGPFDHPTTGELKSGK